MELGNLMKLLAEGEGGGGGKDELTETGCDHLLGVDMGHGEEVEEG